MNVNHEDSRALCEPECTPSSIAVWDIPKCSGSFLILLGILKGLISFLEWDIIHLEEVKKLLQESGYVITDLFIYLIYGVGIRKH